MAGIRVIYDGDCPFCTAYTKYARLRERHGEVDLVNARENPALIADYAARGFDIDESFIVEVEGEVLTKGAAMAYIHAQLAPKWTGLPVLANAKVLNTVYPALRGTRNLTLRLLGRRQIRDKQCAKDSRLTT